ncbi:MAG: hypothetical protein ACETWM_18045 [Candidatus Lokiarchaeia archaeon]
MRDENNRLIENPPKMYKTLEKILEKEYKQLIYVVALILGALTKNEILL